MAYPERGASYRHTPKFIERMKRAEGGEIDDSVPINASSKDAISAPFVSAQQQAAQQGMNEQQLKQYNTPIKEFGPTGNEHIDANGQVHGFKHGGSVRKGD